MKMRKLGSWLLSLGMAACLTVSGAAAEGAEPAELLPALEGTYDELFTVICQPEYDQLWLDSCAACVGEENAQATAQMLKAACTGTIYGEDAVAAYAQSPESAAYDCYFTQNVSQLVFDGNQFSGLDAQGGVVFSHAYEYVETIPDVIACYVYKTSDADAGEFTYFAIAADTPETTYHIELRYGSDLEALKAYESGQYAYWLAAGISAQRDETMVKNVIELFCTENLMAEETPAA